MEISLYGVRGSLPDNETPDDNILFIKGLLNKFKKDKNQNIDSFLRNYPRLILGGLGTGTTSIYVKDENSGEDLIIDGGSGIRRLGLEMSKTTRFKNAPINIFMTHFHWDHLIGLPFFTPLYQSEATINFYCVQGFSEEALHTVFKKPFFPVPFRALKSKINFHQLKPRVVNKINGFNITPYQLQHPDPCWGYKIEKNGKVYSHCVDNEGQKMSRKELGEDLPIYQGVDLCYYDAQYSIDEFFDRPNWGHSTAQIGLEIAMREGVKHMLFAHHDPASTPNQIIEMASELEKFYFKKLQQSDEKNLGLNEVKWEYAQEGTVLKL